MLLSAMTGDHFRPTRAAKALQSEKTTSDLRLSFYRQQAKTFPHGHRCCNTTIPLTRYWSLQFSPGTLESPVLGSPAGPLGDGRGGEGENYKFQHTGTYDPCTDMSDLIAPPGAFPHYVFWLGPFFSSGSPRIRPREREKLQARTGAENFYG